MEDKRNIEILLKSQEEEGARINFGALGRRFQGMRKLAVRILAGALILGILAGSGMLFFNATSESYTLVSFGFNGIEQGLDPNRATFDVTKIEAAVVVQPAILELDLKVTADEVRQALRFEAVVPQDAIERISVIQTIAEKDPKALEELLDISYHPTQYKVSLDLKALGLNTTQGNALLNAITANYRDWFFKTYGGEEALSAALGSIDYATYDYGEAADILGTQMTTAVRYVRTLQAKDASYRATATGLTFADLISQLDTIQNVDIAKLNATISSGRVTKNALSLAAYYQYQIEMATNSLTAMTERLAGVQGAIATYQKDTTIMYGSNGEQTQLTSASTAYDELVHQQVSILEDSANQRARVRELQQKHDQLLSQPLEANATVDPVAIATVEGLIVSVQEKLSICVADINETASEYYRTVAFKDAFTVEIPGEAGNNGGIINVAKTVLLFVIGAEVLAGIILLAAVVVSTLMKGELYHKKEQDTRDSKQVAPEDKLVREEG